MATLERQDRGERNIGRREDDSVVRDENYHYRQLFHVGQIITSEMKMDVLFDVIMDETNQILGTERSTVMLLDSQSNELWSLVATKMEKNEIRIQADSGLAGWVLQSKTPLVINDVYKDSRFCPDIDHRTGFQTKNILCIPIVNRKGNCIGVMEGLNKRSGDFTDSDIEMMKSISHYVAIALENSKLYGELKSYSEELKTTLHHIETLERMKNQLTKFVPTSVARLVEQDPGQLTNEKVPMDVSVLFIDIEGFSKITENFHQRLVNEMVEQHFSMYLECIARHGGEVNETSGDGLMVIFKEGPLETNAQEAVVAGLAIVAENDRLNGESSYPWGRVDLHLGINSGQAWVGATKMKGLTGERWTYTASGLVTVLAARIGALSGKTRLYVGPETHKRIENRCQCEYIGPRKLKNVKDSIPIHWVKRDIR